VLAGICAGEVQVAGISTAASQLRVNIFPTLLLKQVFFASLQ
jgi:hypothetical protein